MAALSDLLVSYKQVEAPTYDSTPELPMDRFSRLQQYISNRDADETSTTEETSAESPTSTFRWHYDPGTKPTTSTTSTTTSKPMNFNNNIGKNAEYAYKYFVSHGIPAASAAGIVGNLYHEDLGNPLRTVNDSHGTTAYGIAGFNSRGDLPNLMKWARDNNIQGQPNFDQQLEYLTHVIQSGRDKNLTAAIMNPSATPEDASYAWGRYFERFAGKNGKGYLNRNDPEHQKRGNTSRQLFSKYGQSSS